MIAAPIGQPGGIGGGEQVAEPAGQVAALDVAIGQRLVRYDVVGEFDDLDVETLGLGDFSDLFHDLRMLARRHADLDVFGQHAGEVFVAGVPTAGPVTADGQTEAGRMDFLSHVSSLA